MRVQKGFTLRMIFEISLKIARAFWRVQLKDFSFKYREWCKFHTITLNYMTDRITNAHVD